MSSNTDMLTEVELTPERLAARCEKLQWKLEQAEAANAAQKERLDKLEAKLNDIAFVACMEVFGRWPEEGEDCLNLLFELLRDKGSNYRQLEISVGRLEDIVSPSSYLDE